MGMLTRSFSLFFRNGEIIILPPKRTYLQTDFSNYRVASLLKIFGTTISNIPLEDDLENDSAEAEDEENPVNTFFLTFFYYSGLLTFLVFIKKKD